LKSPAASSLGAHLSGNPKGSFMTNRLVCFAAIAVLSACGGGEPHEPVVATPASVAPPMGAKALAVTQGSLVSPEEAARQLMDYGEATFPAYFPVHQATQSYAPFLFRYYEQTGIYLGVVMGDGMGYVLNGVYVMGGQFGTQPVYVGLLTDFITPVDPGPPGSNNGCYDLALADTQGTHTVVTVQFSGQAWTQTVDNLVGGQTTFEGQQAVETIQTTTIGSATTGSDDRTYARRTGEAEYTTYGRVSVSNTSYAGQNVTTTTRTVYSPHLVDRQFALSVGESVTLPWNGATTTTISIPGQSDRTTTTSVSQTVTTNYVGRETVTVPAGTYSTCRFENTFVSALGTISSTSWVIIGKGIPVQYAQGGIIAARATSVTLNGQRL